MYLTKNQCGQNEICCAEDNHKYMSNMREKEFSDSNFNQEVIGKRLIFLLFTIIQNISGRGRGPTQVAFY